MLYEKRWYTWIIIKRTRALDRIHLLTKAELTRANLDEFCIKGFHLEMKFKKHLLVYILYLSLYLACSSKYAMHALSC